jgi:hypothetical protein
MNCFIKTLSYSYFSSDGASFNTEMWLNCETKQINQKLTKIHLSFLQNQYKNELFQ